MVISENEIRFKLTREQKKAIAPFYKRAVEAAEVNKHGIIMGQLGLTKKWEPMSDEFRVAFVENKTAIRIVKILKQSRLRTAKKREE